MPSEKICYLSQGDLRAAINKLQIVYCQFEHITLPNVDALCMVPQDIIIKKIFVEILNNQLKNALKIIFELQNKSYSGADILSGMFLTIRSNICNDISEDNKIKLTNSICNGIYNISNITDSKLQLVGCIVDMIETVNKN